MHSIWVVIWLRWYWKCWEHLDRIILNVFEWLQFILWMAWFCACSESDMLVWDCFSSDISWIRWWLDCLCSHGHFLQKSLWDFDNFRNLLIFLWFWIKYPWTNWRRRSCLPPLCNQIFLLSQTWLWYLSLSKARELSTLPCYCPETDLDVINLILTEIR